MHLKNIAVLSLRLLCAFPPSSRGQPSLRVDASLVNCLLPSRASKLLESASDKMVSADHQLTTECRLQPITDTHSSVAPFFFLRNYHTRTAHFRKGVKTRWKNGSCNPSVQNLIRSVIMHSCGLYKSTSVPRPLKASAAASHDCWRGAHLLPLVLDSVLSPASSQRSQDPALDQHILPWFLHLFCAVTRCRFRYTNPSKAPLAQNVGHPQKLVSSSPV